MAHKSIFNKICIGLFLLSPFLFFSQVKVSGKILTDTNEPVAYANIILTNQSDTSVQGAISDEGGLFQIEIPNGTYKFKVSYLGFESYNEEIIAAKDIVLADIIMKEASTGLDEVVVVGEKAKITRKIDRLVFNIENSPVAAGGNANDVLKVAPGLVLKNDEISMLGKGAVRVMIDGRMIELSGQELKSFLNSISADDIKEIEIITNPPARYEAEGNSGLINIIYKKGRKNSWNNTISASHSQAKFGRQSFNNSFSYQKDDISLSFNLGYDTGLLDVVQQQDVFFSEGPVSLKTTQKQIIDMLSSRFSFDYKLNGKTNIGFQFMGGVRGNEVEDAINTFFLNNSGNIESILIGDAFTEDKNNNNSFNAYLEKKLDTLGKKMIISADYLAYSTEKNNTIFSNEFSPENEFVALDFANLGNTDQNIKNYNTKIDFEHPSEFANLSYGAKFSFTNTEYELNNFDLTTGEPVLNPLQSNQFEFDENIQAVYLNGIRKINDQWETQLGLRVEYTQTEGRSTQLGEQQINNNNNYFKVFPTFYLKYMTNGNNQYLLSYSKRIQRPNYSQLNPARYFINSRVSSTGNPFLTPSYNDNIEFSHSFKNNLTTKIAFNVNSNGYSVVPTLNDETNEQIVIFENFFTNYSYSLTETFRVNTTPWWRSDFTLFFNYSEAKKTNDELDVKLNNGLEFFGSFNNSLTLNKSKTIIADINYFYGSPYKSTLFEFSESNNVDIAVSFKSIFTGFNLSAGFYDIFNSSPRMMTSVSNGIEQFYISHPSNRYFRISLAYNFGNEKISAKNRQFGNQDERNRIN